MVPRASPVVAPPPVLMLHWETLTWLASTWSKPLDPDTCPMLSSSSVSFEAQTINHNPLGFDVETKKLPWWFYDPNYQIVATDFDAQTEKPSTTGFEAKLREIIATGFEAKSGGTAPLVLRPNHSQTVNLDFKAQPRNSRFSSPHARCRPHTPCNT
jgi:hypothetical protein